MIIAVDLRKGLPLLGLQMPLQKQEEINSAGGETQAESQGFFHAAHATLRSSMPRPLRGGATTLGCLASHSLR
jgi:hypothetical protein